MSKKMAPFTSTTCLIVLEWNEGRRKLSFNSIANLLDVDYNSFIDQLNIAKESGLYDNTRRAMEEYSKECRRNVVRFSNPY